MLIGNQAHVMGLYPLLRIMNPGVCIMHLFADYVKFCAKVKGQGLTISTFSHTKAYATKFDLDVNWDKVKPVII